MSDTVTKPSIEEMTQSTRQPPEAGHDTFVREKIRKAMKAREDGSATYKTLDQIAAKYEL